MAKVELKDRRIDDALEYLKAISNSFSEADDIPEKITTAINEAEEKIKNGVITYKENKAANVLKIIHRHTPISDSKLWNRVLGKIRQRKRRRDPMISKPTRVDICDDTKRILDMVKFRKSLESYSKAIELIAQDYKDRHHTSKKNKTKKKKKKGMSTND
tara:strand:- start:237 stop:713 length:477 start_codon:yes stop_codon:yes gene_type:complete